MLLKDRTRRIHNKVWTGCLTCKKRHINCDESKPSCQRCQKANLLCMGYRPPEARLFELSKGSRVTRDNDQRVRVLRSSASDPPTFTARYHSTGTSTLRPKSPDLRTVWQKGLLDSFLTTWLSGELARGYTNTGGNVNQCSVPMSAWPFRAWKLAVKMDDSIVTHSLLCLTLCILGSRTCNSSLIKEASRHYTQVLHQFQHQISLFARHTYTSKQDDLVASLATTAFCCAQVDYILHLWTNSDQHLRGIASILQACGTSCLEHEDNRSTFSDHRLLWTSCAVIHRQPTIYCEQPWNNATWTQSQPRSVEGVLAVAQRIPSLLKEYDVSRRQQTRAHKLDLLQRLCRVITDMENLDTLTSSETTMQKAECNVSSPAAPLRPCSRPLVDAITSCYASAFTLHAVVASWEMFGSL